MHQTRIAPPEAFQVPADFQWRNRFVTKDGTGFRACVAWPTLQQAQARASYWEYSARRKGDKLVLNTLDGDISGADLHYVMPMPEKI